MTTIGIRPPDGTPYQQATGVAPEQQQNPARRGPVLLAVHGGESSHAPAIVASLLAGRQRLDLTVLSVIEPMPLYTGMAEIAAPLVVVDEPAERARCEELVRRYVEDAVGGGREWKIDVHFGQTAREICRTADELDATAIVVGAAPRRRLGRAIAGQRAAQILQQSHRPVVSVTPELTGLPRRLVAAVDFSPASIAALRTALLLLDDGAAVCIVHVVPELDLARPLRDASGALVGGDVNAAFARLREEIAPALPPRATVETRVLTGGVVSEVLALADEVEPDLIAVGTHGPRVIERLFVGSVAANVLHLARCSVVAAPAPPPAEAVRLRLRMSGAATLKEREEWSPVLDAFSARNTGRVVTVEVFDGAVGAQVQAAGYLFEGITYDPNDRRVEIMLSSPDPAAGHLTRAIVAPDSIVVVGDADVDQSLEVRYGRGYTVIDFEG